MYISIAICTYNGETFLQEQLDSFASQTRLPDELIVCDDCSKDSTADILERFARKAPFPVKLHFNKKNLGYIKNFEKAIGLCKGDIIALSDQDDVWESEKLFIFEQEFSNPEIGLVYADALVVDQYLNPLDKTMWQHIKFDDKKQRKVEAGKTLDLLLKDGIFLGSSMAFRGEFKDVILPIPEDIYFIHDNWIALVIASLSKASIIRKNLIKYRQHQNQSSSGIRISEELNISTTLDNSLQFRDLNSMIKQFSILLNRLANNKDFSQKALEKIISAREHRQVRATLSPKFISRLKKIMRELRAGNYHKYSNGSFSLLKDLVFSGGTKRS